MLLIPHDVASSLPITIKILKRLRLSLPIAKSTIFDSYSKPIVIEIEWNVNSKRASMLLTDFGHVVRSVRFSGSIRYRNRFPPPPAGSHIMSGVSRVRTQLSGKERKQAQMNFNVYRVKRSVGLWRLSFYGTVLSLATFVTQNAPDNFGLWRCIQHQHSRLWTV